jgi:hypothetical protein
MLNEAPWFGRRDSGSAATRACREPGRNDHDASDHCADHGRHLDLHALDADRHMFLAAMFPAGLPRAHLTQGRSLEPELVVSAYNELGGNRWAEIRATLGLAQKTAATGLLGALLPVRIESAGNRTEGSSQQTDHKNSVFRETDATSATRWLAWPAWRRPGLPLANDTPSALAHVWHGLQGDSNGLLNNSMDSCRSRSRAARMRLVR